MEEIIVQNYWEEAVGLLKDYKLRKNEALLDFDNMCVRIVVKKELAAKLREALSKDLRGKYVSILLTDSEERPVIARILDEVKPRVCQIEGRALAVIISSSLIALIRRTRVLRRCSR